MRARTIGIAVAVLASVLALLGALVPALSLADSVAETGNATHITSSSAVLNGVIDPVYPDSVWAFQYSTTPGFTADSHVTQPQPVGPGMRAVSASVSNLSSGTPYYYRVIVYAQPDTTMPPVVHTGNTASFTTLGTGPATGPGNGRGSLVSSTLRLRGAVLSVVMTCRGAAGALCRASVSVTAPGAYRSTVSCGHGTFVASAPHTHTVRLHPSATCVRQVKRARHHRLQARLTAVWSTGQGTLTRTVTLSGGR
jgi:hypothetical protein